MLDFHMDILFKNFTWRFSFSYEMLFLSRIED